MINVLFALFSILAGGVLAEIAYIFLIIIEYAMVGSFNFDFDFDFDFDLTSAWLYFKAAGVEGGIMGIGISLFRYFGVKGF
ncbi:hypothetical protein [Escherichia coli]|uniref:hypothetical protein n=1 Tax=Escherichia coli TaxID=562 RepID=UPI0005ABA602|nr:hypothetical protein [Escherichia coli]ELQ0164093.1 hypothetical protein [Escherichia coli O153]EJK8611843.1 hypothetical protein [Escherichia coli]EKF0226527.1 hypothetical protein [Escherichia coli]EKT1343785.1 hypothetical protein [Escherichia coli]ELI4978726.1 hypothetical protein [Escherichia coli]